MCKLLNYLIVVCLVMTCPAAQADIYQFNVVIDGGQEVPSNGSPGIGSATVIFNDLTGAISINGSYSGLIGTVTASHLHGYASAGTNAGVLFNISNTGGSSGTISANDFIPLANVANVLNGLTYINIHTTQFGGGEIRGQLVNPIPEPSSLAFLSLGVCGLALRRRV